MTPIRRVLLAATIAVLPFGLVVLHHVRAAGGNYSVLLNVSERAFRWNPMLRERTAVRETLVFSGGYDAQYTYFAAFDPLMRRFAHAPDNYSFMMDSAPYRFGRIGHAWLTRLIAGDRWRSYPATMVWTVLVGCWLTALAIGMLAVDTGRSPWWAASVAAIPGFWQSVQLALPEPIAAAAVLIGLWQWKRGRVLIAGCSLAAALLVRETAALAAVILAMGAVWERRWRDAGLLLAIAGLPLALWKWHVGSILYPVLGPDAFFFNPGTFEMPMSGIWRTLSQIRAGSYYPHDPALSRGAVTFAALLIGAAATAATATWARRQPSSWASLAYAALALTLGAQYVWTHVGNVQRTSTELFVWLLVVAATWPVPSATVRRWAAAGLSACIAYLLFGGHDASTIRQALLLR